MNSFKPMLTKGTFSLVLFSLFLTMAMLMPEIPLMAQQAKTYQEAMTKAEALLKKHQLLDAKAYYQMALRLKANDALATEKIKEIVQQLKAGENDQEKYYNIIDHADAFLENDRLEEALRVYRNALKLVPDDDYAKTKVAEIKERLAREKAKQQNYKLAIQKGDALVKEQKFQQAIDMYHRAKHLYPKNPLAANKINRAEQQLTALRKKKALAALEVEQAERFLKVEAYDKALQFYLKADSVLPGQQMLKDKINELTPKARHLQAYQKVEAEADRLYIAKNYLAARVKYEEAKKLWPDNPDPQEMIRKIDGKMAEQRKNLESNYRMALSQADSLLARKELDNAKAQYQMALNLKPESAYPKAQMNKIDGLKKEALKLLQQQYAQLIQTADKQVAGNDFLAARDTYEKALKLLPDAQYPQKQLAQIRKSLVLMAARDSLNARYQTLLAQGDRLSAVARYDSAIEKYVEAQKLRKNDKYATRKIAAVRILKEQARQQKLLDEKYRHLLAVAGDRQSAGKLLDARTAYTDALKLKPGEAFPAKQIQQLDSLIEQQAKQARLDADYTKAVTQGEAYFEKKDYQMALKSFRMAAQLKPEETLPVKKMETIHRTLEAIAKAKKLQQAYREKIAEADSLFKATQYELSKAAYEKALTIKPDAELPGQKISVINQILVKLEKEKDQRYSLALNKADNLFNNRRFPDALQAYRLAQSIKPQKAYPTKQIDLCNQALALALQKQKAAYAQAISDADKLYAAKIFDKAIHAYQRAAKAMPTEAYPGQMIDKITRYIAENAVTDVMKEKMVLSAGKVKKFSFDPVRIDVRKKNYVLIRAKNVSGKAFRIIFTYGRNQTKNGGFVVEVPKGVATHDFIIRIGNQYKWFSQDNNWFGIYPENQSVELEMIRISKTK